VRRERSFIAEHMHVPHESKHSRVQECGAAGEPVHDAHARRRERRGGFEGAGGVHRAGLRGDQRHEVVVHEQHQVAEEQRHTLVLHACNRTLP
jgi:hypothetical protein